MAILAKVAPCMQSPFPHCRILVFVFFHGIRTDYFIICLFAYDFFPLPAFSLSNSFLETRISKDKSFGLLIVESSVPRTVPHTLKEFNSVDWISTFNFIRQCLAHNKRLLQRLDGGKGQIFPWGQSSVSHKHENWFQELLSNGFILPN